MTDPAATKSSRHRPGRAGRWRCASSRASPTGGASATSRGTSARRCCRTSSTGWAGRTCSATARRRRWPRRPPVSVAGTRPSRPARGAGSTRTTHLRAAPAAPPDILRPGAEAALARQTSRPGPRAAGRQRRAGSPTTRRPWPQAECGLFSPNYRDEVLRTRDDGDDHRIDGGSVTYLMSYGISDAVRDISGTKASAATASGMTAPVRSRRQDRIRTTTPHASPAPHRTESRQL